MSTRTFSNDYKYGTENELKQLDTIRTVLRDKKIKRSEKQFSSYDYKSKSKRIELKSRFNASYKYPTTMLSVSKVEDAESYDGEYYYFFHFTDKLMYIQYDKDQFDEYERKIMSRCDRGRVESNNYVLIPINDLSTV